MKNIRLNNRVELILSALPPIFLLILWESAVRLEYLKPLFFPPPSMIFKTLIEMTDSGELQSNVYASLARIFWGFILGTIPGIVLGLIMGWSERARTVLDPVVSAMYSIPKIAIFPLFLLIFGIGELSKIVLIAIGCFFLVLINSMTGVRNINKTYFEVADNYGAGKVKTFTRIILPASLPMVFSGVRLALGGSLLMVVAAEFIAANNGIGAMIWYAWETLETEKIYVGILICGLLGLLFTSVLKKIEKIFIPWEEATQNEIE
ncbi:MAG TPA: ABC transporter permease [Candidatus Methanoperedens sp.]